MRKYVPKHAGIALIEIVIGAAIILTGILSISSAYSTYLQYALANQKNVEASYILGEGLEVITFMRDSGWTANISKLSTTTVYYVRWTGTAWATTTTPQYVDGIFLRSIGISDVFRDGSDDIAASGTYDSGTRKITATVSYFQGHATTTRSMATYITNIYGN